MTIDYPKPQKQEIGGIVYAELGTMIIEEITKPEPEPQDAAKSEPCRSKSRTRYASSCSTKILGFFVQPQRSHDSCDVGSPFYIFTSKEGKKFADGVCGDLDETLNFLIDREFEVVGSSNGFLLCRNANPAQGEDRYIICNPVTGQLRYIPNPLNYCYKRSYPLAFISKGTNVSSLDDVHNHVVLARMPRNQRSDSDHQKLEVESFCSFENEWREITLEVEYSPCCWHLEENEPAFAIDDMVFWNVTLCEYMGYGSALLAYDSRAKHPRARVIVAPPRRDGSQSKCPGDRFGPSEGKVQYARRDWDYFEIWALEGCEKKESWKIKHWVNLNVPETFIRSWLGIDGSWELRPRILSFHPKNSGLVFMTLGVRTFWYDIKSTLIKGFVHTFRPLICPFFLYEWPDEAWHFDD